MKRWLALICTVALLFSLAACGAGTEKRVLLLDKDQNTLAVYDGTLTAEDEAYAAYADYALREAAQRIAAEKGGSAEQALARLLRQNARILTAADPELITLAAQTGASLFAKDGTPFSLAVTDEAARLTAIYSTEGEITPSYAGSAIKPLSVYAPCIDSGVMHFSSLQEDSPVKTVQTAAGEAEWPVNGTGEYSGEKIPAAEALAQSLNTVAVRWLMAYGVPECMDFLQNSFGIDVSREREIVSQLSEEEVYGNLALGYLQNGVTVCGMAGYYRIFADRGRYTPAYAVLSVTSGSGELLYSAGPETKQVISEASAWIMNRMLKNVVDRGTGQDARIEGVDIVGKTGTSDSYADNWFIGVTPVNTVAIRHGASSAHPGNRAAALFNGFFQSSGLPYEEKFVPCETVTQRNYCVKTGLLADANCPEIEPGYYLIDRLPAECAEH